jgi:hypothetical protein
MSLRPEDRAVGFSLLDVLHVRLGHMSEKNIKYSVRNHLFADCDVQYDEIKDLKMRFCYTCQMGRMHAFFLKGKNIPSNNPPKTKTVLKLRESKVCTAGMCSY